MTVIANRRSVMTLFSKPTDPWSHRARLVLAEKSIAIDIVDVDDGNLPEDLLDLNPYSSVPTLVDRDLVLYDSRVIIEYLDERFPHPPLMPVDPVTRAQFRLALYRIERDQCELVIELRLQLAVPGDGEVALRLDDVEVRRHPDLEALLLLIQPLLRQLTPEARGVDALAILFELHPRLPDFAHDLELGAAQPRHVLVTLQQGTTTTTGAATTGATTPAAAGPGGPGGL